MKKVKVFGGLLALILALGSVAVADTAKILPRSPNSGGTFPDLSFYGVNVCRLTSVTATTAQLCVAGQGFLDAVCTSGGAWNAYTLAMDSDVAGSRSVVNSPNYVLTPQVYTLINTANVGPAGVIGCWTARNQAGGPVRFSLGLVVVGDSLGPASVIYYHLSNGANP